MSRVGYVCIEESFDTIFNMGCTLPPPLLMGRVNRPWPRGLKRNHIRFVVFLYKMANQNNLCLVEAIQCILSVKEVLTLFI